MHARVIYIAGSGRAGSTLLERVLNASPTAFALGEFHCLWRLPAERIVCACGQPFVRCGFWTETMARSGLGEAGLARLRLLEAKVARSLFIARRRFSLAALRRDADVRDYLTLQQQVFDAVAQVTGARHLIDSSKAGPRAWLMGTEPNNLLLHLHRDAVDVIASWRQPKWDPSLNAPMHKPSVSAAAWDWIKAEAWAGALGRQRTVRRIDYATLARAPQQALRDALGSDAPSLIDSIPWLDECRVPPAAEYHSLNGNPDRFSAGPITIAARPTSLARLPASDRWSVRLIGGLLDRVAP